VPTLARQPNALFGPPGCRTPRRGLGAFRPTARGVRTYTLSGVARDSTGAALAGAVVDLFRVGDNAWEARATADGSGNFTFAGISAGPFFVRAVDAGGTLAGATLGVLVAS